MFDFVAYGTYAVAIGHAFFPGHDAYVSLLLSVSTFGVGFATRPLGAFVVGRYADRRGRRPAMLLSLALMGIGSLVIAVLPPARVIGAAAPVLLVAARLLQGIAWGAEAGPATAFLLEHAPPGRRGASASWQATSQSLAVLAAGGVGLASRAFLGAPAMADWGWRIPFALGVLLLPVGLALRAGLGEPGDRGGDPAQGVETARAPGSVALACALALLIAGTVSQYFLNYVTTYALTALGLGARVSLLGTVVVGVAGAAASFAAGRLSDTRGRLALIAWPRLALGLAVVPMLLALRSRPSDTAFALVVAIVAILQLGSFSASVVLLAELFPRAMRATGFGTLYAVAISLFGGTAQIVFTALIHTTGDPASPAWYLAAVNLLAAASCLGLRGRVS